MKTKVGKKALNTKRSQFSTQASLHFHTRVQMPYRKEKYGNDVRGKPRDGTRLIGNRKGYKKEVV